MSIKSKVQGWLFGVACKKAVKSLAKLVVSYAVAHQLVLNLPIGGTVLDIQSELAVTAVLNSGLEMLRNYLKTKFKSLSWL